MSLMAYDQYSRWVRWTPFVPKEEIASLVQGVLRGREEHSKGGADQQVLTQAKQARDQIVIALQLLVIHLARRFTSRFQSLELLDLIQEGNLGLLYAIDHYPTSGSGNGFLGYASVCIRQGLWQAFLERDGMIVIPEAVGHVLNQVRQAHQRAVSAQGEEPSLPEMASSIGMGEQELAEVLAMYEQRHALDSLENPFNEDDAEDIHERVSVFASWVGREEEPLTPLQQRVQEAVAALLPREREVVSMRYGLEGQVLTCLDLAQRMGTTEKAIEGVGYRARGRLRKMLGAGGEDDQQEVGA
jgi:RNA polymerase sigma factor (sigma-70 family)